MWKLLPCANWLRYNQKVTNSMLMTEILKEMSSNWVWRIYYMLTLGGWPSAPTTVKLPTTSLLTQRFDLEIFFTFHQSQSQDCPKCNICIEKNGGCNHMQVSFWHFCEPSTLFHKPISITFKFVAVLQLQARFLLDVPWGLEESWERVLRVL